MHMRHVLLLIAAAALAVPGTVVAQQNAAPDGIFTGSSDIGKTKPGSTSFDPASGTYKLTGGGADMWGEADAFRFTWVKLSGDATISADIHFPKGNLAPLEKAVLVFRQNLEPGSPYADNAIHADGHATLQWRATKDGKTDDRAAPERGAVRLGIERVGIKFIASTGPANGKLTPFSEITIPLTDPVYVGIGVCAHDADGLVDVTFSNVVIKTGR